MWLLIVGSECSVVVCVCGVVCTCACVKKVSFYIAQYPVLVQSNTISTSLGSMLQLMCERLRVHISTTVYCQVLIYAAE